MHLLRAHRIIISIQGRAPLRAAVLVLCFFQWIPAAVFTVGRRASGLACDRHLVLCACLGLLREVSQTQAAVEARYNKYDRNVSALFQWIPVPWAAECVGQEYVM
jgi:hypothetical protein